MQENELGDDEYEESTANDATASIIMQRKEPEDEEYKESPANDATASVVMKANETEGEEDYEESIGDLLSFMDMSDFASLIQTPFATLVNLCVTVTITFHLLC